jgi:hypothetical protein
VKYEYRIVEIDGDQNILLDDGKPSSEHNVFSELTREGGWRVVRHIRTYEDDELGPLYTFLLERSYLADERGHQ